MFDFAETVDSLDTVPEQYRAGYAQNAEGKFSLKPEFKAFAEAIRGNSSALTTAKKDLQKANGESAQRRQVIKSYEDFLTASGVEFSEQKPALDALKDHIDQLSAAAKNGSELKINLDRIKADFQKQTDAIKAEKDGEVKKMHGSLVRYLVGDAATAALANEKGSIELLKPHVMSRVKVVQEGDEFVARVVDNEGSLRLGTTGQPMTVAELVKEMKTQPAFAPAFASEARGGSGAPQQQQQRQVQRQVQAPASSVSKIAAGLAKGQFEGRGGQRGMQ